MPIIPSLNEISRAIELISDGEIETTIQTGMFAHPLTKEKMKVAIKHAVIDYEPGTQPNPFLDDFNRVCQRIAELHTFPHPGLVPIMGFFDMGFFDTTPPAISVVSRYYENGTVLEYLEKHPQTSRLAIVISIAKVLIHLHQNNLVCGEPSPSNILVADDGAPVLTYIRLHPFPRTFRGKQPRPYAAPELFSISSPNSYPYDGRPVYEFYRNTAKSDVFTFGLTAVEILSGKQPVGKDPKKGISKDNLIAHEEYSAISKELWDILEPCWKREQEERPKMVQLVEALETIQSD